LVSPGLERAHDSQLRRETTGSAEALKKFRHCKGSDGSPIGSDGIRSFPGGGGDTAALERNLVAKIRSMTVRGAARVYSELLVEANKNESKARWNPEALIGLSG
jgi:hypothetical protein